MAALKVKEEDNETTNEVIFDYKSEDETDENPYPKDKFIWNSDI